MALRLPRPQTLRSRLLATLVVLLAGVGLAIGLVTTVALRHSLLDRVDEQLVATATRAGNAPQDEGEEPGGGRRFESFQQQRCGDGSLRIPPELAVRAQGAGTLAARWNAGSVDSSGVLDDSGCFTELSSTQLAVISAVADRAADQTTAQSGERSGSGSGGSGAPGSSRAHPQTVQLPGLGTYRVLTSTESDGDVIVTGLPLGDAQRVVWITVAVEAATILVGVAVAALVGGAFIRRDLRPLRRVAATATSVSGLQLDKGEVDLAHRVPDSDTDPGTEVGQVGLALNRMLDHVGSALEARQGSEQRVRQFVADASHELRTPLAAIRGYAELTRRKSTGPDDVPLPPDINHAMARVESEAVRMTGLVEDLLLLARLDSGRPLEHETVDATMLVLDAVSDARVAGPEHHWRLDLPEDAVEVVGDPHRLHQVLANLLANARVHTPPGTTVTTRLRPADTEGRIRLEVADDGPGIPADLGARVFERFARGDSSRSRVAGSTGLGLAIVQAVVGSHHGTVDVASVPGSTVFTVRLPAA
ncbi:sensor histidine kinase [Kineococcus gynurae]|uniref:histidine kinase n=1 Tax=Kineococcus gynurae TaxID=452979 RepID=A0ABV5LUS3_9ACTN